MSEMRPACGSGPRPTVLQAVVKLVDDLRAQHADLLIGDTVCGISSSSTVDAVCDLYRALQLDHRPDTVDLAGARRATIEQRLPDDWLLGAVGALVGKRAGVRPQIVHR